MAKYYHLQSSIVLNTNHFSTLASENFQPIEDSSSTRMLLVAFSELMYALSSGSNSDFRVHWSVSVSMCVCVLCASFKLSKFLFHFIQFGLYSIQLASVKSIDWCFIPRKLNHLRGFLLQPNPKWFVPFQWISLPINTCRFYNAYRTKNMNIEMTWR